MRWACVCRCPSLPGQTEIELNWLHRIWGKCSKWRNWENKMCAACVEKKVKGDRRFTNKGQSFLKVFVETEHGRMKQFTFNSVKGSND